MAWEWGAAGVVLLIVVVFCVRLMKRGHTTLEDERALCDERIRSMEEQIRQDQKNMASSEHLHIALAGLRDMLRLAGYPSGFWLEVQDHARGASNEKALVLHTPDGDWRVSLSMRERQLRAVHKVFFGEYEGEKWHDMRPLLAIDKFVLVSFSVLLILIGVLPVVIAPIVQAGMEPVAARLTEAQQVAQLNGGNVADAAQHVIQIVAANVGRLVAGLTGLGGA